MVPGESTQIVSIQGLNPDEEQDDRSFCTIRDTSRSQTVRNEVTMLFASSTTAKQLIEEVARKFQYAPNSFEIFLVRKNKQMVPISADSDQTIEDLGFCFGNHAVCKNQLLIADRYSESNRKLEDTEINTDSRGEATTSTTTYVPPPAPPPYTTRSSDFLYNYSYNAIIKQETGFVGLVNQAMTCYLNSLLQTLYMTPEFRNALYRWEFDGTEDEGTKSIPFQLQKLFLLLQTSKKSAVGTTELTTSFGWDSSEAWQQHDVQELCRVMFDALEQKFKNTEQSNLISTLYEGKLKDYVKCLQCGYESAREDTFLDVPLVVRPFGSSQAYGSVEEALHAFVTPEILQGSNRYFCEQCNEKCNAHKGLKFVKFPYLLTLQLKRFDFDPITMHRIKLNDRVTFPEILNLNAFVKTISHEAASNESNGIDGELMLKAEGPGDVSCPKSGSSLAGSIQVIDVTDIDEGIDVGMQASPNSASTQEISTNERNLKKSMEKGPYVFELFSIMVHSGSANGGHYYAYIKSFNDGDWYCFNDAQVSKITYDDIQKTYGGGPARGYYSSAYSSSTNAYMLMYRQIDKNKNEVIASVDEFPQHIKDLRQSIREQEEKERQQREIDRYMCKIKLFCQHPVQKRLIEMRLKVHQDNTLAEATVTARKIMGLENTVPLNCCRLVKYDDFNDSLECSFDVADDEPIGELLGGVKSSYKFDLLLELKEPHEEFQVYKCGGTTVKIHVVDLDAEEVAPSPITLRSYQQETVGMFKNQIAKFLNINASQIRMVLELYSSDMKLLDNNNKTLASEGFGKSNKAFIEYKDIEDAKKPFKSSKFYQVLDCYAHTICIHVGLPKVDKIILDKLRIQENDCDKEEPNSDDDWDCSAKTSSSCKSSEFCTIKNYADDKYSSDKAKCSSSSVKYNSDVTNLVPSAAVSPVPVKKLPSPGNELIKKSQSRITTDDSSQDYDEGLGDSEIGDTFSVNGCPSGQGVHSDQSEDSSLTDSERTLVGDDLSPRNNSPDIMGSEIEADADPPQVVSLGSARQESDSAHSSSESNFQLDEHTDDNTNPSSPEENAMDTKCCKQSSVLSKKNACDNSSDVVPSPKIHKYFRAWRYTDETGEKMLRVYVDKRTTLAALKVELEPFVGVSANCFKIYRLYSNNQEFECTRVAENLSSYTDDTRLTVKLGRALRKGEYKVKVYQLCINDSEPIKYLIDWVFLRGMSVLEAKKEILPEIKESCGLDIPLNRCRLRKKSWKTPGTVLLDGQRFEKEIHININWEVFLEVLEDAEPVTSSTQVTVFLRHWHPSKYVIDPFEEIVIEPTIESLNSKISDISGIPTEFVEFAKGQGTFPCEVSTLSIHKELEWYSCKSTITTWTLCVGDDGHVVYYRDAREDLKQLSEEEKRELTNKENARTNKIHKASFSPRKEKALKIYTVDNVPAKNSHPVTSTSTENNKLLVPDLD